MRGYLEKYVDLARRRVTGWLPDGAVESATAICRRLNVEYPRNSVFLGQLIFSLAKFYHWMLHNVTAFAIQRRLSPRSCYRYESL